MAKENKEVAVIELPFVKGQATKALAAAQDITIKTDADMEQAADVLSRIKKVGKMLDSYKETQTRPLMTQLQEIRDTLKPLEQNRDEAEKIIKSKMLAYQKEVDAKNQLERDRLAARVEKGTMNQDTAIEKIENQQEVKKTAQGKVGKIATRKITKYRIVDERLIPREYLTPNMALITDAIKRGVAVPGAESYQEDVIQSY